MAFKNSNLVVIPTYNEAQNIVPLITEVVRLVPDTHILVVDDNSQDGTATLVKDLQQKFSQVHIIERNGKLGLGTAYITAFKWALSRGYDAVIEMDADFSHNPEVLPHMIDELTRSPTVIGSRYVKGGGTENWHWLRKLISKGGSLYARLVLGIPIRDLTGGFNGWQKQVLTKIDLDSIKSEGYSFQIELKYRSYKRGFTPKEIPIIFSERREGQSKMSLWIIIEALFRVWKFRFSKSS